MSDNPLRQNRRGGASDWLSEALGLSDEQSPFPWQQELLKRFSSGVIGRSLDIPTGLGKTAVMGIWLVARACGANIPRRLVYVVDRRAVVDQATREAERLRCWVDNNPNAKLQLGLRQKQSLPISTLRGQYVDNREWLEDPSMSAIIVGTVDMVGSRLLFEGYGVSRKMRPYQAGMLGADTLFVLDEAHLVPPFEMLLQAVVSKMDDLGPCQELRAIVPGAKLLSLSATGRSAEGDVHRLSDGDLKHPVVKKRLEAVKRLSFRESDGSQPIAELLAGEAWNLTDKGCSKVRVIIFSNSRETAENAQAVIEKMAKGDKKKGVAQINIKTGLFVGARRVLEREQVADWLDEHGFLAASKHRPDQPTFLFATSAGEVGVDLDADHMVCDLVAWERMVQRLGRVNRRGNGNAEIVVIPRTPLIDDKTAKLREKPEAKRTNAERTKLENALEQVRIFRAPLYALPEVEGGVDASPGAIRDPIRTLLARVSDPRIRQMMFIGTGISPNPTPLRTAATSPAPLRPALTRPIVDAWSMTSLEKHTGRPIVAPWLRGWIDDKPQTTVSWRRWLPVCRGTKAPMKKQLADAKAFFEEAPPHLSEKLETESQGVLDWLVKRAKEIKNRIGAENQPRSAIDELETEPLKPDSIIGIVLGRALDVERSLKLNDLDFDGRDKKADKRKKESLERNLYDKTLVLDVRFGGISENGLLNEKEQYPNVPAGDDETWGLTDFRVRQSEDGSPTGDSGWRTCYRFVSRISSDGESEGEPQSWLLVEKRIHSAPSEESRAIAPDYQELAEHEQWAENEAGALASRLGLPPKYTKILRIAARLHDEGKRTARWQRAFNAPENGKLYAKTKGPIKFSILGGYRHEFGSLQYVENDPDFQRLSPELQELALHLVAAHHGFARPLIRPDGCDDGPPSALEGRVCDIALRFARLQRRWGPWGLAWWESLLRAADQRASRELETADSLMRDAEVIHG